MNKPRALGRYHIIGIGGIGMSAIAEVMLAEGYAVQGSDMKESANTRRLQGLGAEVFIGHRAENIAGAAFVVVSTAVKPGNPELEAARAAGLPVIRRAEMLAELMREKATVAITGTHGKTTTTALTATLFDAGALRPTVIAGGIINAWGTNARTGSGDWMVVEADESDGTFIALPTRIGIVTNADPEHLDYYGSVEAMNAAYRLFFQRIPFYGLAIAGIDHPVVRAMAEDYRARNPGRSLVGYGVAAEADVRLVDWRATGGGQIFSAVMGAKAPGGPRVLADLLLPMPGRHNALNALAALTAASAAGVSDAVIRDGLAHFKGVGRRFTPTGQWNGVHVYDDYAHHPVEISAALSAAREASAGRVIAIMQPHRYSRLQALFADFAKSMHGADIAVVAPVYEAGEQPIPGIDQAHLIEAIRATGHPHVVGVSGLDELVEKTAQLGRPGDLVIGLGAGTISEWAHALPARLNAEFATVEARGELA